VIKARVLVAVLFFFLTVLQHTISYIKYLDKTSIIWCNRVLLKM